ncbi:hypothetical protein B0H19DRAFT_1072644 [Mycena capillaripes]|nr:hypothetical protein B0H19DRAFT_1072644 [Mycena capillaripes]
MGDIEKFNHPGAWHRRPVTSVFWCALIASAERQWQYMDVYLGAKSGLNPAAGASTKAAAGSAAVEGAFASRRGCSGGGGENSGGGGRIRTAQGLRRGAGAKAAAGAGTKAVVGAVERGMARGAARGYSHRISAVTLAAAGAKARWGACRSGGGDGRKSTQVGGKSSGGLCTRVQIARGRSHVLKPAPGVCIAWQAQTAGRAQKKRRGLHVRLHITRVRARLRVQNWQPSGGAGLKPVREADVFTFPSRERSGAFVFTSCGVARGRVRKRRWGRGGGAFALASRGSRSHRRGFAGGIARQLHLFAFAFSWAKTAHVSTAAQYQEFRCRRRLLGRISAAQGADEIAGVCGRGRSQGARRPLHSTRTVSGEVEAAVEAQEKMHKGIRRLAGVAFRGWLEKMVWQRHWRQDGVLEAPSVSVISFTMSCSRLLDGKGFGTAGYVEDGGETQVINTN